MPELRQGGVALVPSDQNVGVAVGSHDRRGDLPQQRDRSRQRIDVLACQLADIGVVTDLLQGDHPHLRLHISDGHLALPGIGGPAGCGGRTPRLKRPKDATIGRGPAPAARATDISVLRSERDQRLTDRGRRVGFAVPELLRGVDGRA